MSEFTETQEKIIKMIFSKCKIVETFLHLFLPTEATEFFDLEQIQPVEGSFVDDTMREHFFDLLFEAPLHGVETQLVVCLLFHYRTSVDRLIPLHVLRYMAHGWETMQRQRGRVYPMLPIVVCNGAQNMGVSTEFHALFDLPTHMQCYTPTFNYHLIDLSVYTEEEYNMLVLNSMFSMLKSHGPNVE